MKLFRYTAVLLLALSSCMLGAQDKKGESDKKEAFTRAISTLGTSLKLLEKNFVDSISIDKLGRTAVDAMLASLDPYTEYFSREDQDKLQLMTSGEYGGIGAIIMQRPDSSVVIGEPFEGMAADRAHLRAGDRFLEINGVDVRKATAQEVTDKLKGSAGTPLKLLIERRGEQKPLEVKLSRALVQIDPVDYYTKIDGIGYISLGSFTMQASREVEEALKALEKQKISGLVLDLRGNGGGLIGEAVDIVSLFVPKGSVVVSTKGRSEERVYKTTREPIAEELPLVVLIDGQSASSSEIVAGALQDLDRAVVMGSKSFGKGLVQTTMRLPYEGTLKFTTAKYYIPSGRCIQKIDYQKVRNGETAVILPDSLKHNFYTQHGRMVQDAGGILPDVELPKDSLPTMLYYIATNHDVFDWLTDYVRKHPKVAKAENFTISDKDYEDFSHYLLEKGMEYDRQSQKMLEKLEEMAKLEGYYKEAANSFSELKKQLTPSLERDLKNLKPELVRYLNRALVTRYYYRKGAVANGLKEDKAFMEAIKLLHDKKRYKLLLMPKV